MPVKFTSEEISQKYDRFARWYDCFESVPELLGLRKFRRSLIERATGKVLEVAVGTGKNLRYYPQDCRIVAVDVSKEVLNVAGRRAVQLSLDVRFLLADAESLPFTDQCFDTVVSSLSTCTFPNPVNALREMARVCRADGRILLLEHGRSDREWLGRWQDRHADKFARPLGCHWNRETLNVVREAGLKVNQAQRVFFGVLFQIEAQPTPA